MPRRTTPFQRLIFQLQTQLASQARVVESDLMPDRLTGTLREVDVSVRYQLGEHSLVVSIECLEQARRASVEWVEQMTSKHQALPTNKLVLVSASGFTSAAFKKAKALGIDALSLGEAESMDWTVFVGKESALPVTWFENHLHGVTLVLNLSGESVEVPCGPNTALFGQDGSQTKTLGELVYPVLQSWESYGEGAARLLPEDGSTDCGVEFRPKTAQFIKGTDGTQHAVHAVRAYITCKAITMPVALRPAMWRGTPVAYGSGPSPMGAIDMTVIEPRPNAVMGAVTVVSPETGKAETVPLQQQPPSSGFHLIAQGGPLGFTKKKPPSA